MLDHIPDLFHLIRLRHRAARLQVEYFRYIKPSKDVMIASDSFGEAKAFQHLTEIAEADIRIALTSEHPFECLIFGHTDSTSVCSIPLHRVERA